MLSPPPASGEHASPAWIWDERTPLRAQQERTVDALAAIRDTIEARRPLGGREDAFLAQHDVACGIDEASFAQVWRSPAAHAWTWRTFGALRACLAEPARGNGARSLEAQLDAFPVFVEALAHVAGVDVALPAPRHRVAEAHLPGTRLVAQAGRFVECAVVRHEGAELALLPEALCVAGASWPDAVLARDQGAGFHRAQADTLTAALATMGRHQPGTFRQIRDHLQVVAFVPEDARPYPNASSSEHPGAVLLGAYGDPFDLADHLIHEHHHNRLFALESHGALLEPTAGEGERFYSPWRDEPRSLRGLVHGAYVFVPVHDFWADVRDRATDEGVAAVAADHAARAALQLRLAAGVIERHARLTPLGAAVFASVVERSQAARSADDASPAIRAAVADHVARHDLAGDVRAL